MISKVFAFLGRYKTYIFLGLVVLLAVRVILPQLDDLAESLKALKDADLGWILLGVLFYFGAIPVFAFQIVTLALKKLSFGLTLKVEMAGQFVNKLLPSFIGTVSLNMYYMIKKRHSVNQAAAVMTANALTSTIAYTILIVMGLALSTVPTGNLRGSIDISGNLILFALILIAGAIIFLFRAKRIRDRIKSSWNELKSNILTYRERPAALPIAVVCNWVGSTANIFVLYASAHAIGVDISFATALLAYTFGNIAMSLVPTPGGLGAAEAGIYSGLVLAGIPGPESVTITLLYRLISYWLPIVPGYLYFWGLRKNVLSDFSFKKRYTSAED